MNNDFFGVSANQTSQAKLQFCSRFEVIPGKSPEEKMERMKQWGFEGVELPGSAYREPERYRKLCSDIGLIPTITGSVSASGALVSDDESRRQEGIDALKQGIDASAAIGQHGVLYVPCFNNQTKLPNQEIRAILLDQMPALAQYAKDAGQVIVFEPLNRGESSFLNRVSDGAAICRDIGVDSMKVMADFYHMSIEETNYMGAILSAGKQYLDHVHLAGGVTEPRRSIPGQNRSRYVEGFRGLKYIGYDRFCSFECSVQGDRLVEIPKALDFLRREWELAVV